MKTSLKLSGLRLFARGLEHSRETCGISYTANVLRIYEKHFELFNLRKPENMIGDVGDANITEATKFFHEGRPLQFSGEFNYGPKNDPEILALDLLIWPDGRTHEIVVQAGAVATSNYQNTDCLTNYPN